MKTWMDFAKAPDCVRFPEHDWFTKNKTATIDQWEKALTINPPSDYPPKRPKRVKPALPFPPTPALVAPPPPPATPFPSEIEIEVTSARNKKGKVAWGGKIYTCEIMGSMIGLKNGDQITVLVEWEDHATARLRGRRPL